MIYLWNILDWCVQMLPAVLRKSKQQAWIKTMIEPVRNLHVDFLAYRLDMIKRLSINGQTIVLENLLNDLFDAIDRGITIETSYDRINPIFIGQPSEFSINPIFIGQPSEPPPLFIGQPSEYGVVSDFIVTVPNGILSAAQESRLKAIINKLKLLSKTAVFKYQDGTIF